MGQAHPDGRFAAATELATPHQATAEGVRALTALGRADVTGAAVGFINAESYHGTEYLSRKIIANVEAGTPVPSNVTELLAHQNADGGFGEFRGHDSTNLDTAFALEALFVAANRDAAVAMGVTFLLDRQGADGGWSDPPGPSSVYTSALALRALWLHRGDHDVAAAVDAGRTHLLSQRDGTGAWPEVHQSALSLIAILSTLTDRSGVQDSVEALAGEQTANGSFGNDVYVTALALRALHLATLPSPDEISISGRVLDGDTGLPLSGVTALLQSPAPRELTTDGSGVFEFRDIESGLHQLALEKSGYGSVVTTTSAERGEAIELGDIALLKQQADATTGTVRGSVTDRETGAPIQGATVAVSSGSQAQTAADGTYQIPDVPAGDATLAASAAGYASASGAATVPAGGVVVFSPRLGLGTDPQNGAILRGIISDAATGAPVDGALVAITGSTSASTLSSPQGDYQIDGIEAGEIAIAVSKPGYDDVTAAATVSGNATVTFSPALYAENSSPANANKASVSGVVVSANTGAVIPGAGVNATWTSGSQQLQTDGGGRFTIEGIDTATVSLAFSAVDHDGVSFSTPVEPGALVDIGQVRLRPVGVEELLPNLQVEAVDRFAGSQTDPQSLALSGTVTVTVGNRGTAVARAFEVLAFHDANRNNEFDAGLDAVLGRADVAEDVAVGGNIAVAIPVSGTLPFRDAPIHAFADARQSVAESQETDNVLSSSLQCRVQPDSGAFDPVLKWHWSTSDIAPSWNQVMMTPSVAQTNDDNQDGVIDSRDVPDVIFISYAGDGNFAPGILRIVSGADGSDLVTVDGSENFLSSFGNLAVGDLDGDGVVEIVGPREGGGLIAFENDGAVIWRTTPLLTGWDAGGPSIADLDQDGSPEIVIGSQAYRADGTLLWASQQGFVRGGTHGVVSLSLVADIDNSGTPEVVVGASALDAQGQLLWRNDSIGDGATAVGQFDSDPEAEIVIVHNYQSTISRISLLDHQGEVVWGPVLIPSGGRGGPPTVADLDGDGEPEIGVAGSARYSVFEADGSLKWQAVVRDISSNTTGSSVFDFDGDDRAEIIYADEEMLRVYDGETGSVIFEFVNSSGTLSEYPVVANIDDTPDAELIVISNRNRGNTPGSTTGVRVFKDANNAWLPTRSIWNQHTYHIDNVLEDGTIPVQETPSWQTHNTYRLNAFPDRDPRDTPDLTAGMLRIIDAGAGQSATIQAVVGNAGLATSGADVVVRFFEGDPTAGGRLLGEVSPGALSTGDYTEVELTGVAGLSGSDDIFVVVDPDDALSECDETNNVHSIPFRTDAAAGEIEVSTDASIYGPDTDAVLGSLSVNTGAFPNAFSVELQVLDAGGIPVESFGPEALGELDASASAEFSRLWNTGSTRSGDYWLKGILRRDDGTLVDEHLVSFTIGSGAGTRASLRTTTDRPVYHTTDRVQIDNLARNLTSNHSIPDAVLRVTVADPVGQAVLTQDIPLGELGPGSIRERGLAQFLNAAPQGTYRIEGYLLDGAGQALATASASYEVSEDPSLSIIGDVTVGSAVVEQGESQSCTDRITNRGTQDADGLLIRRTVARLDEDELVGQNEVTLDIAAGATETLLRAFATGSLAEGDYACALEAHVSGEWIGLGFATFQVEAPPIRISAEMALGTTGRVLVLLDPPANNGDQKDPLGPDVEGAPQLDHQRAYLEALLTDAGWSYTIVTDADAFVAEQRTGAYSVYLLLSETVKLSQAFQKEFLQAIYRGEGLVEAGGHDQRNNKMDEALGVKFVGSTNQAEGIDLLTSAISSGGRIDYALQERTLRVVLSGAEAQGYAADIAKQIPVTTTYDYGDGKAVYAGFDLLIQTTDVHDPSLYSELLEQALVYVQPSIEPKVSRVVPVTLTLTNEGIPIEGRVVLTLPAGTSVEDPGPTAISGENQLTWDYSLAEGGELTVTFWMRLPAEEGQVTVHASIQTGEDPSTEHATADLEINVVAPPGIDAAVERAGPHGEAPDRPNDIDGYVTWLSGLSTQGVREDLENARAAIEAGQFETALEHLLSATEDLEGNPTQEADELRRIVADIIFEVGQML